MSYLADRFEAVGAVAQGWDSYGAEAPTAAALASARPIARHGFRSAAGVSVFPMRDGGIQFDVDTARGSGEIEVSPNGKVRAMLYKPEFRECINVAELVSLLQP